MTEEEKKAIKNIKEMIENIFKCEDDEEFVCDVSDGGYLQTALNLIQKKDTEINKLNNAIKKIEKIIDDEFAVEAVMAIGALIDDLKQVKLNS